MKRGDFLDKLVEKVNLNDEEKVSILLDLLLAGYETTSGLMALVVYFLAQAPSSLKTLQVIYIYIYNLFYFYIEIQIQI